MMILGRIYDAKQNVRDQAEFTRPSRIYETNLSVNRYSIK